MRNRTEQILRIACLALGALVLLQLIHAGFQAGQLVGVKIPPVPALETNSNLTVATVPNPETPTTNSTGTTATKIKTSVLTNSMTTQQTAETNSASTNVVARTTTTNNPAAETNLLVKTNLAAETNSAAGTNSVAGTNSMTETNSVIAAAVKVSEEHLPVPMPMPGRMRLGGMPMMPGMAEMGGPPPKLPPAIQAEVDKIVSSEILGPVLHPLPMALLGIAGDTAFLRTASGQTGLVNVGDSLGDLKLLQIGVNRVLVEENGQKKELMIFDGIGGDSLLPKQNKTQNDHNQSQTRAH